MARKRKNENKGLPARWTYQHGAYYYQVPNRLKHFWDGKSFFRLGKTQSEAYAEWSRRLKTDIKLRTIGDLFDRYIAEILPTLKPVTRKRYEQHIPALRAVLGDMRIEDLEPQHVYQYYDKRKNKFIDTKGKERGGPATARHEINFLSGIYGYAVRWGCLKKHPFRGEIAIEGIKARKRYIEDWEVLECLSLTPKQDSTLEIQAYIRFKLLTALRKTDILKLTVSNLKDDGIHINVSKTDEPIVIEWTPALKDAVQDIKAVRRVDISPYLFCTNRGKPYYNVKTGLTGSWDGKWQRFMKRVIEETKIEERFTEHDLRAKSGSDAESLTRAQELLAHADSRTTERFYRRKPKRIKPAE